MRPRYFSADTTTVAAATSSAAAAADDVSSSSSSSASAAAAATAANNYYSTSQEKHQRIFNVIGNVNDHDNGQVADVVRVKLPSMERFRNITRRQGSSIKSSKRIEELSQFGMGAIVDVDVDVDVDVGVDVDVDVDVGVDVVENNDSVEYDDNRNVIPLISRQKYQRFITNIKNMKDRKKTMLLDNNATAAAVTTTTSISTAKKKHLRNTVFLSLRLLFRSSSLLVRRLFLFMIPTPTPTTTTTNQATTTAGSKKYNNGFRNDNNNNNNNIRGSGGQKRYLTLLVISMLSGICGIRPTNINVSTTAAIITKGGSNTATAIAHLEHSVHTHHHSVISSYSNSYSYSSLSSQNHYLRDWLLVARLKKNKNKKKE